MFKSYFLTALRNLIKHPVNSTINIFGLAMGLACCVTLLIFITYQLSYDTQFSDYEKIHTLKTKTELQRGGELTQQAVSIKNFELIKNNLPNLENVTSLETGQLTIQRDIEFTETVHYTDSQFFELFDFPFLEGNARNVLDDSDAIVLTKAMARKYFGSEPALGRSLPLSDRTLRVAGVIDDIPDNTHLNNADIKILASVKGKPVAATTGRRGFWNQANVAGYLKLRRVIAEDELNRQIASVMPEQTAESPEASQRSSRGGRSDRGASAFSWGQPKITVTALPIHNSHLTDSGYIGTGGSNLFQNWYFTYVAGGLALSVLLISCINFINLTTARFTQRNREIGLRKVLGAGQPQVFTQFICETFALTLAAVLLAMGISQVGLPWFGQLVETDLTQVSYLNSNFFFGLGGLIFATTLLAGFYPSLVLSRVKPVAALGAEASGSSRSRVRKVLTVLQFAFSILLITTCMTLYFQVNHLKNLDLGFELDNIAVVPTMTWGGGQGQNNKSDILRLELESHTAIHSVSTPVIGWGNNTAEYQLGDNDPTNLTLLVADYNFFDHYQIKMLAGERLSKNRSRDKITTAVGQSPQSSGNILLTHTGLDKLGIGDPRQALGKTLTMPDDEKEVELEIVGVADAFPKILESQNIPIGADFIVLSEDPTMQLSVRIRKGQFSTGKEHIAKVMNQLMPNQSDNVFYPKQMLDVLFTSMTSALASVALFAFIAIVIAMLGLYAMSTFVVERRTREIGIRKVLGASVARTTSLLLWDFSKPVVIALLLAVPPAYLGANLIIQHIAARIPLEWITFGVVPLITITVALLTVSSHTIKAANIDPVKALRYE